MINIYMKENIPFVSFSGNNFKSILEEIHDYNLNFNKTEKAFTGSLLSISYLIPELQKIEQVVISEDVKTELMIDYREIIFNRNIIKNNMFKVGVFKDYQKEDIKLMISRNRFYNACDMGLGKTYETITALNHLFDNGSIDRVLIVCPKIVRINWKKELLKFALFCSEDDIFIVDTINRDLFNNNHKVNIVSYSTFKAISDSEYKKKTNKQVKNYKIKSLLSKEWGINRCIVLDEAHNIKNTSIQTKRLFLYKNDFKYRYLLSGTPIPNGIEDFYYQAKFLDEALVKGASKTGFIKQFGKLSFFSKTKLDIRTKKDRDYYDSSVKKYFESISQYYVRRLSEDYLDLPELIIKPLYYSISEKQNNIYKSIVEGTLQDLIETQGKITLSSIMNKFPYMVQSIENPLLLQNNEKIYNSSFELKEMIESFSMDDLNKIEYLDDIVKETQLNKEKLIVWDYHPLNIEILAKRYEKYNPFIIHGKTTEYERNTIIEEFKTNKNRNIAIFSFLILDEGINIVEAAKAFYFCRTFNIKHFLQSMKRIHRIGQNKNVVIYYTVAEKTLDEVLNTALERKQYFNFELMEKKLTTKDLKSIFKGININNLFEEGNKK